MVEFWHLAWFSSKQGLQPVSPNESTHSLVEDVPQPELRGVHFQFVSAVHYIQIQFWLKEVFNVAFILSCEIRCRENLFSGNQIRFAQSRNFALVAAGIVA